MSLPGSSLVRDTMRLRSFLSSRLPWLLSIALLAGCSPLAPFAPAPEAQVATPAPVLAPTLIPTAAPARATLAPTATPPPTATPRPTATHTPSATPAPTVPPLTPTATLAPLDLAARQQI